VAVQHVRPHRHLSSLQEDIPSRRNLTSRCSTSPKMSLDDDSFLRGGWVERRDAKVERGAYDVSIWCETCGKLIDEKVPDVRIPTIVDRTCGIIYEWSYMAQRWYKNPI